MILLITSEFNFHVPKMWGTSRTEAIFRIRSALTSSSPSSSISLAVPCECCAQWAQCVMVFEQTIFCRSSTMVKRWHTTQQSCERQPRALQLWSTLGHTPTMFLQTLEILLVNYRDILSTCDHTDDKDWHERLWQSHNREVKPNAWLLPTHTNKNKL